MKGIYRAAIGNACLVLVMSFATQAYGDSGKDLFERQCSDCHTIGGGDAAGPDLKGVVDKRQEAWLVQLLIEPGKLTAARDPVKLELIEKYGFEMPGLGLSGEDASKIVAFLEEAGGTKAPRATNPPKPRETVVTPGLVARGKALFTGHVPFAGGGAPCAACHSFRAPGINGGNLAADLTDHYEGMGEQGLRGALKSLKFPVMKRIYADRPLRDDEVSALVVFTKDAAAGKKEEPSVLLPLAGLGVFVCCLAILLCYKRRSL